MAKLLRQNGVISIHAPRTGSDVAFVRGQPHRQKFQSTLPARGATASSAIFRRSRWNFNPRSPHGERPERLDAGLMEQLFQSTLPARGATTFPFKED